MLRATGVNVLEAALLAKEALQAGKGRIKRARTCIALGSESLRMREKTVSFRRAVEEALLARKHRRARTIRDFRYLAHRLLKRCKGLAKRRVRSIKPAECAAYLQEAFDTPRQRNKARLILSGVFSTACKRGWCAENPVRQVEAERVVEKRIRILSNDEISRLMSAAESYNGGSCLAAVGMMLYAGIRPHEVERLHWEDLPQGAGVICISPQHSKTGGARHVTIHPPLANIISRTRRANLMPICPRNWVKHWAELRKAAGFTHWQPDILRHTFATHHLSIFRDYSILQYEMGHRSSLLLRTRYVAMESNCNMLAAVC